MSKDRKTIKGLPVSADTVDLLIRINKQAHQVIMKLQEAAKSDNIFSVRMGYRAAEPLLRDYVKLGGELQEAYVKWSEKVGSVPVQVLRTLSPPEGGEEEQEVLEAEFESD